MIFSTDKTLLSREIQEFLPFASNYDLERVIPLLEDTEKNFLVPLLGTDLHDRLTKDMETCSEEIKMCRKAVSNIMVYMNFTLLNTQILPGGFTRISGDNTSSLYKYQEEDLKKIFRRNGFDQLDVIVEYFVKNLEHFPEFKTSDYYISGQNEVIPDRFVFAKYYKAVSHVVFKHLQPFIPRAIDLDISPVITIDETVLKDTNLLKLIRPVAIYLAVAYAIEDSGVNIDETGVWLENKVPADGIIERNPLSTGATENLVARYRELASRYMDHLTKEVSGASENINVYARDNKNKKTIWM